MSEMIVVKDSTITTCAMAGLGIFSHAERSSTSSAFAAGLASPKGFAAAPDLAKGLAPAPGADPNAPVSAKGDAPAAGGLDALAGGAAPNGLAGGGGRGGAEGARRLCARGGSGGAERRGRGGGGARLGLGLGRGVERRGGHVERARRLARAFRARRGLVRLEGVLERQRLLARHLPLAERAREGFGRPLARLRHRRRRLLGRVVLRGADGQPSPPAAPTPPRRGRHPPERRSRAAARPEARARGRAARDAARGYRGDGCRRDRRHHFLERAPPVRREAKNAARRRRGSREALAMGTSESDDDGRDLLAPRKRATEIVRMSSLKLLPERASVSAVAHDDLALHASSAGYPQAAPGAGRARYRRHTSARVTHARISLS